MISEIEVRTSGELDIVNITSLVEDAVRRSGVAKGMVFLFLRSTTSALIINEDEEGLRGDLRETLKTLIPRGGEYAHNRTWGEENAHSHLRSILLGNSLQIPLEGGGSCWAPGRASFWWSSMSGLGQEKSSYP